MPFTKKKRSCRPFDGATYYKPRAVPMSELETVELELDELEAIHLCDFEGLHQKGAAQQMQISSSTLQRLLYSGRKKIADAIYSKKAIKILTPDDISTESQSSE